MLLLLGGLGVVLCCWVIYDSWPTDIYHPEARLFTGLAMLGSVMVIYWQGFPMLTTLGYVVGAVVGWYVVSRALWIAALWGQARREDQFFRAQHPEIR